MKVKLQLDMKSIQAFVLENVEKIGFGVVGLICLFMVYRALAGVKRYDRTPDQLLQEVRKGEDAINQSTLDPGLTVTPYLTSAQQSRQPVQEQPYDTSTPWDPPVFQKKKPRESPALFAAQQLGGTAEVGPMNMLVPAAEAAPAGPAPAVPPPPPVAAVNETCLQRWVVVTGLVPVGNEESAFNDALKKSVFYDPQNDYPKYLGYYVQRVEAPGPSDAADLDWTKAKKFNFSEEKRKAVSRWAQGMTADVVAPEYLNERLAFPLGPLVGRQWDESVVHPPEIPILPSNDVRGGMGEAGGGAAPHPGNPLPADKGIAGHLGRVIPKGGTEGGQTAQPRDAADTTGTPFDEPGATNPGEANAPSQPAQNATELKPPAFLLLRFFDYTAEPGKHYVYRVRLALANPNYIPPAGAAAQGPNNLKLSYLTDPELAKKQWLETEWSEPSPVISTPPNTRVLALSVTPGREPRVMVAKWVQRGFEAFHDFSVVRGQVANFLETIFTHSDAGNLGGGHLAGGPSRRFKVNYYSNTIAIDFRGGEKVSHRMNLSAPGEILLWEPDGTLVVRNELDDKAAIDRLKAVEAPPPPPPGGPAVLPHPRGPLDNPASGKM